MILHLNFYIRFTVKEINVKKVICLASRCCLWKFLNSHWARVKTTMHLWLVQIVSICQKYVYCVCVVRRCSGKPRRSKIQKLHWHVPPKKIPELISSSNSISTTVFGLLEVLGRGKEQQRRHGAGDDEVPDAECDCRQQRQEHVLDDLRRQQQVHHGHAEQRHHHGAGHHHAATQRTLVVLVDSTARAKPSRRRRWKVIGNEWPLWNSLVMTWYVSLD